MTSQPSLQTIKGNKTMKFGQLLEYNKKNGFLQELCRK